MHLPKPTEGGDFTPPPAGTFPAICYRFLDLGTQQGSYMGKPKIAHKVLLSWELHDEEAVLEIEGQLVPMTVHKRYTWSMGEKANLRKDLESWHGVKFKDSDFGVGGWDVRKLLGAPCMLGITHKTNDDNKVFANVTSISKLPKQLKVGTLHNHKQFLWLSRDLFDKGVFEALSESLQNTIKASPEYAELSKPGAGAEVSAAKFDKQLDEDIPF